MPLRKLIVEGSLWAWMSLHPRHLKKMLARLIVMTIFILIPLILMNWYLASRGAFSQ
jgi:hypothetical protein